MSAAALGFRSELIFHCADGEVLDCRAEHGCRVIRTPSNPTFFWGNYLLFDRAPVAEDAVRWPRLFERLIAGRQPESTHRAFGWIEDSPGDIVRFVEGGYQINNAAVMLSTRVPEVPAPTLGVQLRALCVAGDGADSVWSQLVALHVATRAPQFEEQGYWTYAQRSVERWRRPGGAAGSVPSSSETGRSPSSRRRSASMPSPSRRMANASHAIRP